MLSQSATYNTHVIRLKITYLYNARKTLIKLVRKIEILGKTDFEIQDIDLELREKTQQIQIYKIIFHKYIANIRSTVHRTTTLF